MTNSTTGIGIVELLIGTKRKIISTGHEGVYGGSGGVAPLFKLETIYSRDLNFTPRTLCFISRYKPLTFE